MKRRALLAATAGGAALLAGCAAAQPPGLVDDDDQTNDPGDDSDDPDPSERDDPENDAMSGDQSGTIETRWSDCGGPIDDSAYAIGENHHLRIRGTAPAPNPCHEAVLDSVERDGDFLEISVDVASTLGEDEDCIQCHGAVGYAVTIDVPPDEIDTVAVGHALGDRHELTPLEADDVPVLGDFDLRTVETACQSKEDDVADITALRDSVQIAGARPAPDPCHRATIVDAAIEDGRLSVEIGVEPDEAGACVMCTGVVEYELTVGVVGADLLTEVRVDHVGAESHAVASDGANADQ